MSTEEDDASYVAKAHELAKSGKFKTYFEVEAALILQGYPSLVVDQPFLAGEIDALCKKAQQTSK